MNPQLQLLDRLFPVLFTAWLVLSALTLNASPLFDYDETVYAQVAVDMLRTGEWLLPSANGLPFYDKPPFTYYLMAACFSAIGENAFAARLPSLLFTAGTAWALMHTGSLLVSRPVGRAAALIYLSLFEVGFLAHAAILDPALNFFLTLCFLSYLRWLSTRENREILHTALWAGCAVSIKGPVGLVIPLMVIGTDRLLAGEIWSFVKRLPWSTLLAVFLLAALPYYLLLWFVHGSAFLADFIRVHNISRALSPMQGHSGGWHYYLVVFAISALPFVGHVPRATINSWRHRIDGRPENRIAPFCWLWTGIVILLFTLAQTKLPHYISSVYPAVALALALAWFRDTSKRHAALPGTIIGAACVAVGAAIMIALPTLGGTLGDIVRDPRAAAVIRDGDTAELTVVALGTLLMLAAIGSVAWASRGHALAGLVLAGFAFQFTLIPGLGGYAGELMQAPLIQLAQTANADDAPLISYRLNAPSVSFYGDKNFVLLHDAADLAIQLEHVSPLWLMLREEDREKLVALENREPVFAKAGFLLYRISSRLTIGP